LQPTSDLRIAHASHALLFGSLVAELESLGGQQTSRNSNMKFSDLETSALQLNDLYEQLEIKMYGRVWTTEELALGFVGDIGDLAKLIQADAGVRKIDDCKAKLGHELSDCLWSIIVLANKCGIDLEAEFSKHTRELVGYVSRELDK
jgi:NTP pyrophosphatase (non-canonical NTP hydrolase)